MPVAKQHYNNYILEVGQAGIHGALHFLLKE